MHNLATVDFKLARKKFQTKASKEVEGWPCCKRINTVEVMPVKSKDKY